MNCVSSLAGVKYHGVVCIVCVFFYNEWVWEIERKLFAKVFFFTREFIR